jgi:outer membrane protein OmpA-like peptidoglycan-associated protein
MEDITAKSQIHAHPMISRQFFFAFVICHLSLVTAFGQGQRLSTQNKRAEKLFFSAIDSYQAKNYDQAVSELKKAIEQDPLFTEAYILQGDIFADNHQASEAISSYNAAIKTNQPFSPDLFAILARMQLSIGIYKDAQLNFQRYLEFKQLSDEKRQHAEIEKRACEFAIQCMAHPVLFEPVNLGDSINTRVDEYINAITADDEKLYFTRLNPKDSQAPGLPNHGEEDFYVAKRADSGWSGALNLGPPINTHLNEGALNISPDGKKLFFAGCNRPDGHGRCDIYWARWVGDHWTVPENLGELVNSPQWDSQPSCSSDGKTLYFASNRPGGKGSSDIWKTELQSDGQWTLPVNLGDSVNTKNEEMAPFIHPDDQTLYFSSKGHPGMGKLDLFYSRKSPGGAWNGPVNMGYPINTFADEISLVVRAKGDVAYISSNVSGGKGGQDVYKFQLYPEARPQLTTYFKGVVYDDQTKVKLEARFELIDLETSAVTAESLSDGITGEFLLVLPTDKNYALNVSKDGYLFFSENFSLRGSGTQTKPFIKNIPLKPIKPGEAVVLKNIFFETDKFILRDESLAELAKLLDLLQKNPKLKIEISGHTDNMGTAEHNLELSGNRARAVYSYLIQHGIAATRLSFAGYGFSQPIDNNSSDEGRANNRRTEFKVMGN